MLRNAGLIFQRIGQRGFREKYKKRRVIPVNIATPMSYTISLISTEECERLAEYYAPDIRYEVKSEIYGCCIKLLCQDHTLKDT